MLKSLNFSKIAPLYHKHFFHFNYFYNMIRLYIIITLILVGTSSVFSQQDSNIVISGKGNTVQPTALDTAINAIQSQKTVTIKGYQLQISATNDFHKAQALMNKLKEEFPQLYVGNDYKTPNYRIRIGAFRTQMEASKLLNEINGMYPGAFIVSVSQLDVSLLDH